MPTAAGWSAFRRQLDRFDVWRWSALYANFDVMDGTSWHVELRYPDQGIRSSGSNDYPPNFDAFLRAVRALSGGPVTFPDGSTSLFIRDPDRNVLECHQASA